MALPRAAPVVAGSARVLLSLEMATLGSSGIPQDTRLLHKGLLRSGRHAIAGVVMENQNALTRRVPTRRGPRGQRTEYLDASHYFLGLSGHEPRRRIGFLSRMAERAEHIQRAYFGNLFPYRNKAVPREFFAGTAWRQLFQRTLPAEDMDLMGLGELYYTNLTFSDMLVSAMAPFAFAPRLDTKGFNVAIFADARPIKVTPGTAKIIRYHDAIPVSDPDLLGDGLYTTVHYRFLQACRRDSYFVCNSAATRASLLTLFPSLEPYSTVIPCANEPRISPAAHSIDPTDIFRSRLAISALGPVKDPIAAQRAIVNRARLEENQPYLLAVAAIEPKKNVPTIVRAWERVRFKHKEKLRLVIVGKPSWNTTAAFAAMRPHVLSGDIIHMEDLPFVELQALYLNARALVFPSYAEGFGYPPVEALTAGAPVVVSDIPALRDTLGDAAVYVNPFDVQDVANGVASLLYGPGVEAKRRELVQRGGAVVARYALSRVIPAWDDVIARVRLDGRLGRAPLC